MNEAKHQIAARLYNNHLTADPHDLLARVDTETTLSVDDICHAAVTRGGADVSEDTLRYCAHIFLNEMGYQLCDGFAVNADSWFRATPHIRGAFHYAHEPFDPQRHRLLIQLTQGNRMRRALDHVDVRILGPADATPYIDRVTDCKTHTVNGRLTPGHMLDITGSRLKIVGDHPDIGVRLRHLATDALTLIPLADLAINQPRHLLLLIPTLSAGTYRLELTTQFSENSHLLKAPVTTIFKRNLTVE